MSITGNSGIAAETHGPGAAGAVSVHAGTIHLAGPDVAIDSRSLGTGEASTVSIRADSSLVVARSRLEVDAGTAPGGNLIVTGPDLIFHGGALLASSGASGGGSVSLHATNQVLLLGTRVTANGGGNGGNISIDPLLVTLDRASLTANGGINGGNITIRPAILLESGSLLTASGATGVAGSIAVTPPDVALAGSLVALAAKLALPGATLISQCAQKLGETEASSFVVTGKGGVAPDPSAWQPDPSDRRR
jgi:hypothetical protein